MKTCHKLLCIVCACAMVACKQTKEQPQKDTTVSVAVFSINDYHGAFVPDETKNFPGAANIIETLDSLKQVYPYHLTLAGGDNFGGSYFSAATKSALMPAFFQLCGINLSVLGNHEFDNGQESLALKFAESPYQPEDWTIDYIAANVKYDNDGHPDFCMPYALKVIPIDTEHEVRILLKGLLTSSTATQTRASNIQGLKFDKNYADIVRKNHLQSDVQLLLSHIGSHQRNGRPKWEDPNDSILSTFTKDDFDGIFSAHTHEEVCGYINADSIPIVQGRSNGYYISLLECVYDTAKHELVKTIPQLVKVNHHLNHGVNAMKMKVIVDDALLNTKTEAGYSLGDHLTIATENLTHDRKKKHMFTEVATLVCESYAEAYKTARLEQNATLPEYDTTEVVIGVSHFGSIRAGLAKGDITVLDVGETQPFFNEMRAYRLSGKEVKELVEFGLHNDKYGWLQTSGLQILCNNKKDRKVVAIYHIKPGGEEVIIKDNDLVTIVADEYLATGGDGFSTDFYPEKKWMKAVKMPKSTDCLIAYLKTKESLHTDSTLNQRLRYEK